MKQRLKQVGKGCPKLSFRNFGPFPTSKVVDKVSPTKAPSVLDHA